MFRPGATIFILICTLFPLSQACAQTTSTGENEKVNLWRLCPAAGLLPVLDNPEQRATNGQIILNADIIESQGDSVSQLSGNVIINSDKELIHAERAVYQMDEQKMDLSGNVRYRSELFEFNADAMTQLIRSNSSEISNLDYFIPLNHIYGSAEKVTRESDAITYLYNMTYTTCSPENIFWQFKAREMKLNHASGTGLAKHMSLRIKDVPVLYFPALSFPISDRRKSGFLYPTLGDSSNHGFEMEIPYYWNIAPQADATITPHSMRKRGIKLDTEWRYLNSWSKNLLNYEYLDDDLFNDRRRLVGIQHSGALSRNWSTQLTGSDVSDSQYLKDFGDNINDSSLIHLSRTAALTGQWDNWKFTGKFQSFQTIDETIPEASRPYRLLPELSLSGFYPDIGTDIEFELESTYTIFDKAGTVNYERFDISPRLLRPFGNSGWFITPALSGHFTSYQTDDPSQTADQTAKINRSVPIASLDSGLIFERSTGDNALFLQTFEPRIFYLYVPFRQQDDLPILDTSEPAFEMYQLFTENRFVGIDRIGDANQAALNLTSRWLSRATGEERFRASVGQLYYYDDRLVTLPNQQPETLDRSGILAELGAGFGRYWTSSLNVEWNPESQKTDKALLRLRYNRQDRHILNLSYRYRRASVLDEENLEQSDISFSLPLSQRWSMVGRQNRSIEEKLDLDRYLGFEYESCCWAFRILGRKYLLEQTQQPVPVTGPEYAFNDSIYFELIFKGFARSGGGIGRRLEENITSYKDPFE